ncbi:L,D-transpeptidase [Solihabitans fulvus]|uniref:L,D-transpeptidase n=2 Tax=Solihabitans fulvus TaxID=1892852 RepID=A0A5B2XNM8_9PSEU|nr:L,D-transpeptidase [Solihabitans fulvus]
MLTACGGGTDNGAKSGAAQSSQSQPSAERKAEPAVVLNPAKVATEPANGTDGVSPAGPFRVTVTDGTLTVVTLTNPDGKQIDGQLAADKLSWTAAGALGYDKTYTWAGTAIGKDSKEVPVAGSFHTLAPARKIGAEINVADNATYGIAMPISLTFSSPVKDKVAVQKALTVQTSVPTPGAWAWLSDTVAHWRPQNYWTPGTKVTVTAKIYGVPFGNGAYGLDDLAANFAIGRSEIVRGNTQTHRLVVIKDGQQIFDFPASYGLDSDPGRVTHSGTHVVMEKAEIVSMSNLQYGYKDVKVPWGVRIDNFGEYIHGYEGSRAQQGNTNVSHGCANLAPENAKLFYDQTLMGDPVEITGTNIPFTLQDGDYSDWTLDWAAWTAKSAA